MIDVWQVIFNALWIVGLSVLLATWSYARYAAYEAGVKTRQKFAELPYALALNAGLFLFIAGMAATESRWWARVLWILLGIGMIVDSVLRVRQARPKARQAPASPAGDVPPAQDHATTGASETTTASGTPEEEGALDHDPVQ